MSPREVVYIGNVPFESGVPPDAYHEALGKPDRIVECSTPAPYGHRNNQQHQYDSLGISLNEHHSSRLVHQIRIELIPSQSAFPTHERYRGDLNVCGIDFTDALMEKDFLAAATRIPVIFKPHLGWSWYIDGSELSVTVCTYATKTVSGGNSRKRRVYEIDVSYCNAHK